MDNYSIMEDIESVRSQLNALISQEISLSTEQVVEISQELDELIYKYYHNITN